MAEDPFHAVKREVQRAVSETQATLADLRSSTRAGNDGASLKHQLTQQLQNLEWDITDLNDTVSVVERDLLRFSVSQSELQERKRFVEEVRTTVRAIHRELQQPAPNPGGGGGGGSGGGGGMIDPEAQRKARARDEHVRQNDDFVREQQQQQQMILEHDDEQLDMLHESVLRIGRHAENIRDELSLHERIITRFEDDMDRVTNKMVFVQKGVDKLLKQKDTTKICFVVSLGVTLIVLVTVYFVLP